MLAARGAAPVPDFVQARVRTEIIDVPMGPLVPSQVARDPCTQAAGAQGTSYIDIVSELELHRAQLPDADPPPHRAGEDECVGSRLSRQRPKLRGDFLQFRACHKQTISGIPKLRRPVRDRNPQRRPSRSSARGCRDSRSSSPSTTPAPRFPRRQPTLCWQDPGSDQRAL
jgi:hypothetical protein